MGNQQSLSSSSLFLEPAFEECAGSMQLCCVYARDAAEHGRFGAAHGLFQSAILLYDRAWQLAAKRDALSLRDASLQDDLLNLLETARAELDSCALVVYPENITLPEQCQRLL